MENVYSSFVGFTTATDNNGNPGIEATHLIDRKLEPLSRQGHRFRFQK